MATAEKSLLEAQPRTAGNKNDARRVQVSSGVPGHGAGKGVISLSLDPRQVSKILHSQTGHNTIGSQWHGTPGHDCGLAI